MAKTVHKIRTKVGVRLFGQMVKSAKTLGRLPEAGDVIILEKKNCIIGPIKKGARPIKGKPAEIPFKVGQNTVLVKQMLGAPFAVRSIEDVTRSGDHGEYCIMEVSFLKKDGSCEMDIFTFSTEVISSERHKIIPGCSLVATMNMQPVWLIPSATES
ncbi:MAG: hypothetical protein UT48_C0034G0005 [Parcubacteria group bacterium GW2011_GWE2_39_37]|uniref:Uncharacterized protein n=1 Tax=Candidatus Falkowbacteria bacterium GW2011_GWF2_39_8 TaxID=1618642 RepID=A0A0G0SEP8_9BACT|nr:MAG: hypothetical protein UT48_C0034G0005 [Parcubacteria group bacterium GW2011_GWE2_39_37]KKR33180.1 MAG: hypothetical protein UT64_C0013G0012 [Candidatus Falkowbacteria bacterium GW2011_GWF2_39_8]